MIVEKDTRSDHLKLRLKGKHSTIRGTTKFYPIFTTHSPIIAWKKFNLRFNSFGARTKKIFNMNLEDSKMSVSIGDFAYD